ncbi:RluA family pseudouridine synthase [Campylobacter sputorum]|uniref:RluA family pseudouridine synthase n=1 Tax=Campylobacter sputorum TaxID=206 RepID=UPI000B78FE77|nr:RluA family pseudouridine synthase [Campylobacter sputorum]KAB0580911.1 RluA family pseudouridine synthase [Campylobacter sputorum subsp. sputorum]
MVKEIYATINDERLDIFLSRVLDISRNQITNLIKNANVKVNDILVLKPSFKIEENDKININFPQKQDIISDIKVDFDIEVIYEDDDLLVINKPPNLVVHSAPSVKEHTLVDWLVQRKTLLSNINGENRPGIVHRLDKGTSGVMVVAKNNIAHEKLSLQLRDKTMGRIYLALCDYALKENCIVEKPIGRNPSNRLKKGIVENGRYAKSAFVNVFSNGNINLIAAKLFTGRTHQIRVHLSSISRHILGDNLYGFKSDNDKISRVMLHAFEIYFIHPSTNLPMSFCASLYSDFLDLIKIDKEFLDENLQIPNIRNLFCDISKWVCHKSTK